MAFTEITKGEFTVRKAAVNSVRVKTTKKITRITISKDILNRLGNPIFFRVAVGSGKHAGFVALIPTRAKSDNAYRVHDVTGSLTFTTSKVGRMSADKTTQIPHEITDDGLVIDIRPVVHVAIAA